MIAKDDKDNDYQADPCNFQFVIKKETPVVSQQGTGIDEENGPGNSAGQRENQKFGQRELGDSGGQGNKGAYTGKESARENSNGTVIFKPVLGGNKLLGSQTAFRGVLQDEAAAPL